MENFTVYPAIDLRGGKVVRLVQGDPGRQTIYGDDPADAARRWLQAGAAWLHVVNLDGAFGEAGSENLAALQRILQETARARTETQARPAAQVQFGGGLRSLEAVAVALDLGVARVLLGTAAVEQPGLVVEALDHYGPERIGVAIDVRGGSVQVRGWQSGSDQGPDALGRRCAELGVRHAVYTRIERDGGGQGADLADTQRFAWASGLAVIASGGVNSLEDVRQARRLGLSGIITGRALYAGTFRLQEALQC